MSSESFGRSQGLKSKPRLIPVKVPWQISPSTPFLRLRAAEIEEPTHVSFVAHFGLYDPPAASHDGREVEIVYPPDELFEDPGPKEGPYQFVVATFQHGLYVRMYPGHSDAEVIEEAAYDRSALSCRYQRGENIREWLLRFREEWRRTGVCPDPGMYEVEDSPWLEELDPGSAYKHYLMLGHDAYVEVAAEGWSWKSMRVLKDW
jgi:hypothetical protein